MLENDIPVIYSCNVTGSGMPLFVFENNTFNKATFVNTDGNSYYLEVFSHYMVATGLLEFSSDFQNLIGKKTMIRTATYGKEYYVDFDDYKKVLSSMDSNIMYIKDEM